MVTKEELENWKIPNEIMEKVKKEGLASYLERELKNCPNLPSFIKEARKKLC